MRTIFSILLLVLLTTAGFSQIAIDFIDVPLDWGIISSYWTEADTNNGIPVNLGTAGGGNYWDFSAGDTTSDFSQTIVPVEATPYAAEFAGSNLVMETDDLSQFGLEGPGFIYYSLTPTALNLNGLGVEMQGMEIPVVLEDPVTWYELPLDYGDEWQSDFFYQMYFDSAGMEYRIDLEVVFDGQVDAWGDLSLPGWDLEALRIRNDISIDITVYLILFGIPIEVYNQGMSYISYLWAGEDTDMSALVMSQEGETNPNFNLASTFARLYEKTLGNYNVDCDALAPPVQLPAGGGSFTYGVSLDNNLVEPSTMDIWSGIILPNNTYYGPMISRSDITMPGGASIIRELSQNIPAGAPTGNYYYLFFMGDNTANRVMAQGGFGFEKLAAEDNSGVRYDDWLVTGWYDEEPAIAALVPEKHLLLTSYPNPFNAETTLQFDLPEAGHISLRIFDVQGREASVVADGYYTEGLHDLKFDAGHLAGGIYFARLETAQAQQTQRMIMLK